MNKGIVLILLMSFGFASFLDAQVIQGLRESLTFESCQFGNATVFGNVSCECGVRGESAFFDGQTGDVKFTNDFSNTTPNRAVFTLNFYFKPSRQGGNFVLLSKRTSCTNNQSVQISYNTSSREISLAFSQDVNNFVNMTYTLADDRCWNMITVTRVNNLIKLFVNGEFVDAGRSPSVIDLGQAGPWTLGSGPCVGSVFRRFRGNIDEFAYYSRELTDSEIQSLYYFPDVIDQRDTTLFLGDTLELSAINTCSNNFFWDPDRSISNRRDQVVKVFPDETTIYSVEMNQGGCVARDFVKIVVVDPDSISCDQVFLANAFTPNGDSRNPVFKIDNPVITESIEIFQIFDRWGGVVFETTDVYEGWDGTILGEDALPGVYVYKIVYDCNGEEKIINGSVTLLR